LIEKLQHIIHQEVENYSAHLPSHPAELYDPIRYTLSLGGKRIRPLLTLLACDLYNHPIEDALPAALAIELFHNFSLVHDDIMDHAPLRRNKPTVHQKWNSSVAILSGDVMLVKTYELLSKTASTHPNLLQVFNDMATKVCEGQQLDMNYEKLYAVSTFQYFKMIEYKTAVLLAASLKIGALIAGASKEEAEHLYNVGKYSGLAFQLQDDLLDVYGEEEKFGKQKGGDIITNKKTFLLLKAIELSALNAYKKEELYHWLSHVPIAESDCRQKIEGVKSIYDFCNVKKITETEIENCHQKALSACKNLSASNEKKKQLIDFITSLLKRDV
jgi:geranylgeranyl diphosphate synthase, type II